MSRRYTTGRKIPRHGGVKPITSSRFGNTVPFARHGPAGPKITDIPFDVRKRVREVLAKSKELGQQKGLAVERNTINSIAAGKIVKIAVESGVEISLIADLMLKRKTRLRKELLARLEELRSGFAKPPGGKASGNCRQQA